MSLGEFIPPLWITVLSSGLFIASGESVGRYIDDPRALDDIDDNFSSFMFLSYCVGILAPVCSGLALMHLIGWKPALAVFAISVCASCIYFFVTSLSEVFRALMRATMRAARQGRPATPSEIEDEMAPPPFADRRAIQLGFSFLVWPLVGALGFALWLLYQQGVNR